jgi:pimeloyl-ACP methyl ester carboxylesterase
MHLWPLLSTCSVLALGSTALLHADDFMSKDVKIHYEVKGKGEPVILIHGLGSSAKLNWELPGTVAELAKHYQVIAFDNRGHGRSDKPQAEGQYGVNMVDDVVRLMDHLELPKAHVVGYSLGGMIALKLAVLHPERVNSVVLGGMGWLQTDTPLQHFWEAMQGRAVADVPPACLHGIGKLAVTAADLKAVHVPVTTLVGDRDICRRLYVEPLEKVRPDWLVHVIKDAGHIKLRDEGRLQSAACRGAQERSVRRLRRDNGMGRAQLV